MTEILKFRKKVCDERLKSFAKELAMFAYDSCGLETLVPHKNSCDYADDDWERYVPSAKHILEKSQKL